MNKRGQSIIEYSLIAVLIILGIVLMGPYIVRSIGAHFKMWDDQIQDSSNEHYTQGSPNDFSNLPGCECSSNETIGQCGGRGKTITCLPNQKLYFKTCTPANCQIIERCVNDTSCCNGSYRGQCGNVPLSANPDQVYPTVKNCFYGQRRLVNNCTGEITGCIDDTAAENIDGDSSCAASCTGIIPVDPATGKTMAEFCPNTQNIQRSMPINFVTDLTSCSQSPITECRVYCKTGYQLTTDGRSCEPIKQCQTFNLGQHNEYTATSQYVKIYLWSAGGGGAGGGGGGSALMEAFVKLIPNGLYFLNIGSNGIGGSSQPGQSSNGTTGNSTWFSSAFTNPQNANLYLTVDPGRGGTINLGGEGGASGTAKGAECFKIYKGGKGGAVLNASAGAGGGGGAGGNGLGGQKAGAGEDGLAGQNNPPTPEPAIASNPPVILPQLLGGKGGNGGYIVTESSNQPGTTPGGGGGGGNQLAGGVGGAGRITICQVPDFITNKTTYCPDQSENCAIINIKANGTNISGATLNTPIDWDENQQLFITGEAFYNENGSAQCREHLVNQLPATAKDTFTQVWNANYGDGDKNQGCAGYGLSNNLLETSNSSKTTLFNGTTTKLIIEPGDSRNVEITATPCTKGCTKTFIVPDDTFVACPKGYYPTQCVDTGYGNNHGTSIENNGCRAWEADNNHGGSSGLLTCQKGTIATFSSTPEQGQNTGHNFRCDEATRTRVCQSNGYNSVISYEGCYAWTNPSNNSTYGWNGSSWYETTGSAFNSYMTSVTCSKNSSCNQACNAIYKYGFIDEINSHHRIFGSWDSCTITKCNVNSNDNSNHCNLQKATTATTINHVLAANRDTSCIGDSCLYQQPSYFARSIVQPNDWYLSVNLKANETLPKDGIEISCTNNTSDCAATCNNNGLCEPSETAANCPNDCHSCLGSTPTNSTLCPGDDSDLPANAPMTLVKDCTNETKCEFKCQRGFMTPQEANCPAGYYQSRGCPSGYYKP